MKKSLILGLLGLAATAMTTFGQGTVVLDNYNTSGPFLTYGDATTFANGTSGALGTQGANITAGSWTVGIYWALGNTTGSVAADPTHIADPLTLGGSLALGASTGSTAHINDSSTPIQPGAYLAPSAFPIPGSLAAGGQTVTLMIVAYSGASYNTSNFRGHSVAFTLVTTPNTALIATQTGTTPSSAFSVFTVTATPEPSVLALSGLAAAAMMLIRRKKA